MPGQKLLPYKGIDFDSNELYIGENSTPYMKGMSYDLNKNAKTGADGRNVGTWTPEEGNERYGNFVLPPGVNQCVGEYYAQEIKQTFVFVWNSINNHTIYRMIGRTGIAQIVLTNPCLNLSINPDFFIAEVRCTVQIVKRFNPITKEEETVTYLIFTKGFDYQHFICIEDCIATNGFDATLFPYFSTPNDPDCVKCEWFRLGVPTPSTCIGITPIKRDLNNEEEKGQPNLLNNKTWQFRVKFTNVWGQDSEHGVISDMYINNLGNSCLETNFGPRCLRLKFNAGCPLIDKIQVEFRNCSGASSGFSVQSDWQKYDLLNKYNDCDGVAWWLRTISNPWQEEYDIQIGLGETPTSATEIADSKNLLKYNAIDNSFEYTFCANKQCQPLPVSETNRDSNALPRSSGSVFTIFKNIGFANNKRGFFPIDCDELDKIDFTVTKPVLEPDTCKPVLRKVTIYGVIYNPFEDEVSILRPSPKLTGQAIFAAPHCPSNNAESYEQVLPKDQQGIIGYLAGTNYYAISKQCRYFKNTGKIFEVGLDYETDNVSGTGTGGPSYAIQKWEMFVLPGQYIFRIASHKASPLDEFQKTSTYVFGRTELNNPGASPDGISPAEQESLYEVVVDTCTSDFSMTDNPFMILDLTRIGKGCAVVDATAVVCGYLYEDEVEKRPIEKALVHSNRGAGGSGIFDNKGPLINNYYTDHNGFYFIATSLNHLQATLYGFRDCASNQVLETGRSTSDTPFSNHFKEDKLYVFKLKDRYHTMDRVVVRGRVVLCDDNSIGVPGVLVLLTRSQFAFTDNEGNFAIVAHDYGDNSRVRHEKIIYSQRNCQILNCSEEICTPCFPQPSVVFPPCLGVDRNFDVANLNIRLRSIGKRGPQMGGRYRMALRQRDWLGRASFANTREKYLLDIPSLQETQTYDYSKISFAIDPSFRLDSETKYINFAITKNLNQQDFLTWVAERIQFVDNTGNINNLSPTSIRIYYESLGEYNKQNNFSTTTLWQFLETDAASSRVGDLVEVVANGDGTIYNNKILSLVTYDKDGRYIQINYSDDLKGLTEGALIKLIRPNICETEEFYYDLCPMIRVIEGIPQVLTGIFNFFDSYMQNRTIPVPLEIIKTTKDKDGNEIKTSTTINQLRSYPFFFEHHSPSDKWGDHCFNKGRVSVKNDKETVLFNSTEIALSKALTNNSLLNYLHYFTESDAIILDQQNWLGITGISAELNFLLVICERDNFVMTFNDNTLRVVNGQIVALSANERFGRPEKKIGSNFGCAPHDINTIRKYDGLVHFVDSSQSALVQHNYSEAVDISFGGIKSWMKEKVRHVIGNDNRYFHGIINPKNKKYILANFEIKGESEYTNDDYVNLLDDKDITRNEAISFDIYLKTFPLMHHYTPEYFAMLPGEIGDEQLFSLKGGYPYRHHNVAAPYLNFFGVQCKPVIWAVANIENTKVKKWLYNEIYCPEVLFYAFKVLTEPGQESRILPEWFEKRETFWAAAFLCDINTLVDPNLPAQTGPNKILDGDLLYGTWIKVGYTIQDADAGKYFQFTGIIITMFGSEKSSSLQ